MKPLAILTTIVLFVPCACLTPDLELPATWEEPPPLAIDPDAPATAEVRHTWYDLERTQVREEHAVLVYSDGRSQLHGLQKSFYPDGKPRSERAFDHDRPKGVWRAYWPTGGLRSEIDHGDGEHLAPLRFWFENGTLAGEGQGLAGIKEGDWRTWYENGVLRSAGAYSAGLKEGAWTFWDEEGRESARGAFQNGRRFGTWLVDGVERSAEELDAAEEDREQQHEQPEDQGGTEGDER